MATQTRTQTSTRTLGRRRQVIAWNLALALAACAALVGWTLLQHGHASVAPTDATVTASKQSSAAVDETVYLVSSQEQADRVQARIDAEVRNADLQGAPEPDEQVVVDGSEMAALVMRLSTDLHPAALHLIDARSGT